MNRIVLFDMDGTLTEPRKSFDKRILGDALYSLTNIGVSIGIVTGSDEDYLREQMGEFLQKSSCRYKTYLLPCNGTKFLKPPAFANEDFNKVFDVSMEQELGKQNYHELIKEIVEEQAEVCNLPIPLTGHFINCRGSMINWCPIGRNATEEQRQEFVLLDKKQSIRRKILLDFREQIRLMNLGNLVTVKLGGDTSFDIYPTGWDKTYALNHLKGWQTWFIGDRCCENGNDYEIFKKCQPHSYVTTGPEKTKQIIEKIRLKLRSVK